MGTDRKRQAYQERREAQLREWAARIESLRAKADRAKAEAKIKYLEQIEAAESKLEVARARLKELVAASDEVWEELKEGVEEAWEDVRERVEVAIERIRSRGGAA